MSINAAREAQLALYSLYPSFAFQMLVANVRSLEEKESIYNINYQHGATTAAYLLFDNLPGIAPQEVLPRKLKVAAGSQINALSSPPRDWDPSVDFTNFKKNKRALVFLCTRIVGLGGGQAKYNWSRACIQRLDADTRDALGGRASRAFTPVPTLPGWRLPPSQVESWAVSLARLSCPRRHVVSIR